MSITSSIIRTSQVQVLDRQVLGFWGRTLLRTIDPHQPPPPFVCGGLVVSVHTVVYHIRESASVGEVVQVVACK